jgi:hypothetical protein
MPQQPAVIGRLEKTVIDSPDPRTLAAFYCQVLDMKVNEDTYGWVVIGSEPGLRQLLLPGRETLPSNGLQQLQFGIVVRGPDVLDPATPDARSARSAPPSPPTPSSPSAHTAPGHSTAPD